MAAEKETNKESKTYTEAEVKKMLDKQQKEFEKSLDEKIAAMVAEKMTSQQPTAPVIQMAKDEYVTVLYIGAISSGTSVNLGRLGRINRAGMTLDIPKKDFIQGLGTPVVDALLMRRSLIVVNGLTDEERERFNLSYKEGELLTQKIFYGLLNYEQDEICRIFAKLCPEHQVVVAKMFNTAYFENHDNRIHVETVKELNKLSKKHFKDGLFTLILADVGNKFADDDE